MGEMGDDFDTFVLSFTAVHSFLISFIFCSISYTKFNALAHLFLKNQ